MAPEGAIFFERRALLCGWNCCSLNRRNDVRVTTIFFAFNAKQHRAGDLCKQRVVFAHSDIQARMKLGAALTHDDGARVNQLTAVGLDAQTL